MTRVQDKYRHEVADVTIKPIGYGGIFEMPGVRAYAERGIRNLTSKSFWRSAGLIIDASVATDAVVGKFTVALNARNLDDTAHPIRAVAFGAAIYPAYEGDVSMEIG